MPFRTDRLQQLRQQRNLSQADLAADLELSQNQLYRYEAGESSPKDDALIAMAEYFNTSTDYLLGLSHVAHPEDVPRPDFTPEEAAVYDLMRGESSSVQRAVLDVVRVLIATLRRPRN